MASASIFDIVMKTISEVQKKNKASKTEPTADKSVFDQIRERVKQIEQKSETGYTNRTKTPGSLMDQIKREIEKTRRENSKDSKVATAPGSIFDRIIKKVEEKPARAASTGIKRIIEEYNIDVRQVPADLLNQVQQQYFDDLKKFNKQYAQAIYDLSKRYK